MYESNKNSIVNMHRNSYIAFGHAGSCNMWITAPVTESAGDGIYQSQQIQVIPWPRRVLTYFKFRILKGPLIDHGNIFEMKKIQLEITEIPHGHGLSFKKGVADGLLGCSDHKETIHSTHSASYERGFSVGTDLAREIAEHVKA